MKRDLLIQLKKALVKCKEVTINDNVYYTDGELEIGTEITDENGVAIADGEYIVEDKKITIVEGKISEIETVEPEAEIEVEVENEETPAEEQPAEKDEKDLRIEELEGLLKDRDAIIEELNQKIKELENKVAQPVEEPIKMNKVEAQNEIKNSALKYFQD